MAHSLIADGIRFFVVDELPKSKAANFSNFRSASSSIECTFKLQLSRYSSLT